MPATLKELLEKKGRLWKEARDLNDKVTAEERDFTPEERTKWDALNSEINRIEEARARDAALRKHEHKPGDAGDLPGRGDTGAGDDKTSRRAKVAAMSKESRTELAGLALQSWLRANSDKPLSKAHKRACSLLDFNPNCRSLKAPLCSSEQFRKLQREALVVHPTQVFRALSATDVAVGGALVASEFSAAYEINQVALGGVLPWAEVVRTAKGGEMSWPGVDDASNEGVQVGENTAPATVADPVTSKLVWYAYKFSSGVVKVPYEALEDSAFDVPAILGRLFGERLGRIKNRKFTLGNGNGTAQGITVGAATGKVCASTTAITADELIEHQHKVDPAYRVGGAWMMHDAIVGLVRRLKVDNNYLWQAGLQDNVPDRLLGAPVALNQHMADTLAASAVALLYGQLSAYKVRQVGQLRSYRLQERYREEDQDGFVAFERADGKLLTASTSNTPVKKMLMAAS